MEPPNEYVLTADEQGMLAALEQQINEAKAATEAYLRTLIRYRRLGDGNWNLADGKLTKG